MATLQLKVQYFQDSTPTSVPCREENFIVRGTGFRPAGRADGAGADRPVERASHR